MSTPTIDPTHPTDPIEPSPEAHVELIELGKVSETQGGAFGFKIDAGLGWWFS